MAENFFSIFKTECIYRHKPSSFRDVNDMIERYILFYNRDQAHFKTGISPLVTPVNLPFSFSRVFVLSVPFGAVQ